MLDGTVGEKLVKMQRDNVVGGKWDRLESLEADFKLLGVQVVLLAFDRALQFFPFLSVCLQKLVVRQSHLAALRHGSVL